MDDTLNALGELLLTALPTFFLVLLLHFYLKRQFFGPMQRVLDERRAATEGARRQADESFRRASEKADAYEEAIRTARNEIYREQEEFRRQWRREQSEAVESARQQAQAMAKEAKQRIAEEADTALRSLLAESEAMAERIVATVLERRAG